MLSCWLMTRNRRGSGSTRTSLQFIATIHWRSKSMLDCIVTTDEPPEGAVYVTARQNRWSSVFLTRRASSICTSSSGVLPSTPSTPKRPWASSWGISRRRGLPWPSSSGGSAGMRQPIQPPAWRSGRRGQRGSRCWSIPPYSPDLNLPFSFLVKEFSRYENTYFKSRFIVLQIITHTLQWKCSLREQIGSLIFRLQLAQMHPACTSPNTSAGFCLLLLF